MRLGIFLWIALAAAACTPAQTQQPPGTPEGPSVAVDDLTSTERHTYAALLEQLPSSCASDQRPLNACLQQPGSCCVCQHAAVFVVDAIRSGRSEDQIQQAYRARFGAASVKDIDVGGEPSLGPADALVTVVEFADFECPYCAAAVARFDELVEAYAPDVRVVFKNYPLPRHEHANLAAQATIAAHNQGKFWPMHHTLFANQSALRREDILGYARSLNLDMARFGRDLDAAETIERVEESRRLGQRLQVNGTPAVFINGRPFDFDLFDFGGDELQDWIDLEIQMLKRARTCASTAGQGAR